MKCESFLDQQLQHYLHSSPDDAPNASPRRTAVFDLVMPADEMQYDALNKMAIVGVKVVGRDASDFPVHGVFFEPESENKAQLMILPVVARGNPFEDNLSDSAKELKKRYGDHAEELFVLLPIRFLSQKGKLGVQLKDRTQVMILSQLPLDLPADPWITNNPHPAENPAKKADQGLVLALLQRYYCLKI